MMSMGVVFVKLARLEVLGEREYLRDGSGVGIITFFM